mgnify:CR=1 FL=1
MKITVLGCHGSDQVLDDPEPARTCGTCGFLINDLLLVDAGTVGRALTLDAQRAIQGVLLSHVHFDHIQGLPTLADNRAAHSPPLSIAGLPEVLAGLRSHIFNDTVYPDFFRLPTQDQPTLRPHPLTPGESVMMAGFHITPIRVNHLVPAAGFLISDGRATVLYSGDTHQTDELWRRAREMPDLAAAFIETSYPNHLEDLAARSKHLTPRLLQTEFQKLGRPDLPLYVYHLKPRFKQVIMEELQALSIPRLSVLDDGQGITL